MSAGRWDDNAWHRRARHHYDARNGNGRQRRIVKILAITTLLGIGLVSAATATWNGPGTTEYIGICHATGSDANPYVFLVAPVNGFEHGHHRHHQEDFFVDPAAAGCFVAAEPAPAPEAPAEGDATEPEAPQEDVAPPAEEPGLPDDNEIPDEPEPQPEPAPDENVTGPDANETVPEEEPLPPPGDAALSQSAVQDDFVVTLTFSVSSVGEGVALDVTLQDTLPEMGRPWYLGGADSSRCTLDARTLTCWFGDLEPGATRTVLVRAYTDRMPCGQTLTNTAWLTSEGDAEARNDRSSASVAARGC